MPLVENIDLQFSTNCNYLLHIDKYPDFPFYVSAISMPDISFGIMEMSTPTVPVKKAGTSLSFGDISLTFYVDDGMKNYQTLLAWILAMKELSSDSNSFNIAQENLRNVADKNYYSNITITFLNSQRRPTLNITFEDAFPTILSGFVLTSQSQHDFNTCDVTFTFTNFEFKSVEN